MKINKEDRLIVYTALFGPYDNLVDPEGDVEGCDFVCFTDQKELTSQVWEVRVVSDCDLAPNLMNRKYKMLPHLFFSEYRSSLYVDANVVILKNPYELKEKYLSNENFVLPRHFSRACIYEEAFVLLRSGRVDKLKVIAQMASYLRRGYRCQNKMGENNILLRNHNELVDFMAMWWGEFVERSKRDQLSLSFVAWRGGFRYTLADMGVREGEWFGARAHAVRYKRNIALKAFDYVVYAIPFWVMKSVLIRLK